MRVTIITNSNNVQSIMVDGPVCDISLSGVNVTKTYCVETMDLFNRHKHEILKFISDKYPEEFI